MSSLRKLAPVNWAQWADNRATAIWTNLCTNHLWQRVLKNTIATTICIIIAVTPSVVRIYGSAAYLAAVVTVFGHPGRRFGQMAEALVLAVMGSLIATAWSTLGIYLSSLIFAENQNAAYTIKALFLTVSFLVHGFLRSHSPRLFLGVVLLVIVCVVSLTGAVNQVSTTLVTSLLYPILTGVGVLLAVNVLIFPEFASAFLGITTIETLGETITALRDAGQYFVLISDPNVDKDSQPKAIDEMADLQPERTLAEKQDTQSDTEKSVYKRLKLRFGSKSKDGEDSKPVTPKVVKIQDLTAKKAALRTKLAACKDSQQECNFELTWAVLPPRDLKFISDTTMKKLVANAISLIGACESKYALIGDILEGDKHENLGSGSVQNDKIVPLNADPSEAVDASSSKAADASSNDTLKQPQANSKSRRRKSRQEDATIKMKVSDSELSREKDNLKLIKPQREIESGDAALLKRLLHHISHPIAELQKKVDRSIDVITSCLVYCYDVQKLPSGALPPSGISLAEVDIRVDILVEALDSFDKTSAAALEKAAKLQIKLDKSNVDIMPRMETFLISSFLLNLRQAAFHTLEMLKHCRVIVEKRQARHDRKMIHIPHIKFRKWLASGEVEDKFALPQIGRKKARTGGGGEKEVTPKESRSSTESSSTQTPVGEGLTTSSVPLQHVAPNNDKNSQFPRQGRNSVLYRLRTTFADFLDYFLDSEDIAYAIKLTIAAFLVCFPAFIPEWNEWFRLNRALWACLQLILVFEVALGISIWTFVLRAVGTSIGCAWGYAAYEAGSGNRAVLVLMLVIGIIPSAYIQLGSKYIKAGMVSIISMSIVAIGTLEPAVPGTATETFLRRLVAFFVGGVVALAVEALLFPVRARHRLIESIATSIQQISDMEACLAYGVESGKNITDLQSLQVSKRFDTAKAKAQTALAAAETFLPACANEPRLKGSFKGLELIYTEILYVLHAIVDRMEGMHHLRFAYGSGVLEEFNTEIFHYRRNVAGSITVILFAAQQALTTRLPLPQYLPSARLAHLRLVNRVREIVAQRRTHSVQSDTSNTGDTGDSKDQTSTLQIAMVKKLFHKKFLAWNAAASGHIEVIEYLEELVDLVKLLVGVNEFRSGMFTRPTYQQYVRKAAGDEKSRVEDHEERTRASKEAEEEERNDVVPEPGAALRSNVSRRRTLSTSLQKRNSNQSSAMHRTESQTSGSEVGLPPALQRMRSRRLEEASLQSSLSKGNSEQKIVREDS